jgi:hypothetical protein
MYAIQITRRYLLTDFTFILPRRGENENHRNESCGPDIDEILRDLTRAFMRDANRSPAEMANGLNVTTHAFNRWLAGQPGQIDLLSRYVAAMGADTADQVLSRHPAYVGASTKVVAMREMLLARLSHTASIEDIRIAIEMQLILATIPEVRHIILRSFSDALDYAENNGYDVKSKRVALERGLSSKID